MQFYNKINTYWIVWNVEFVISIFLTVNEKGVNIIKSWNQVNMMVLIKSTSQEKAVLIVIYLLGLTFAIISSAPQKLQILNS